jgi:hypothetical protein
MKYPRLRLRKWNFNFQLNTSCPTVTSRSVLFFHFFALSLHPLSIYKSPRYSAKLSRLINHRFIALRQHIQPE